MKVLLAVLSVAALSSGSIVKAPGETFELLILHNNDMHARFEQTSQLSGACTTADREAGKCYGGFPRVAHVVKEARRAAHSGEGPPVLYLNAGDTYTGTAWFTIYKWKIAAEFVNALQPDAVSLGNHELDDGVSGLIPFVKNVTCPVVAANLILTKEPELQSEKNLMNSVIFDVNGTRVGIIGYLTPETRVLARRNNIEYIEEVTAIKQEAAKLKSKGIKILIALGHSGFEKDLEIAREVEDIDLVIGGHTNTFLYNGTSPDSEKPEGPYPTLVKQGNGRLVPAVQAYAYTKYLGKLYLTFDSNGELISSHGNPIVLDKSIPQDPEVLDIVDRYRREITQITETVVGNTSIVLDGQSCRLRECNMGNMITDAIIHKYASEYRGFGWTDAPIAVIQGGGIRASIAHHKLPANITKGDLLRVTPFDGFIVKGRVNGSIIFDMLEHSVSKYNPSYAPGQFLQMSGMMVVYDFQKPPGMRVLRVYTRCGQCLKPDYHIMNKTEEFNILLPAFISMGGDGFSMLNGIPSTILGYNELDSTEEYITHHSPLYPSIEGRIIIKNRDKLSNSASYLKLSTAFMLALVCSLTL